MVEWKERVGSLVAKYDGALTKGRYEALVGLTNDLSNFFFRNLTRERLNDDNDYRRVYTDYLALRVLAPMISMPKDSLDQYVSFLGELRDGYQRVQRIKKIVEEA